MSETTDETRALTDREECEALLAWREVGQLTPAEAARLEAGLARYPDLARQVALIGEDREAVADGYADIRTPVSLSQEALIARLPWTPWRLARRLAAEIAEGGRTVVAAVTARSSPGGALLMAAMAGLIVLGVVNSLPREPGYETASGGSPAAGVGATVLVRFQPAATMEAVTAELAARGMRIVDGPKPGQLYMVEIGPTDLPAADRTRREGDLRTLTALVALVLPTAADR